METLRQILFLTPEIHGVWDWWEDYNLHELQLMESEAHNIYSLTRIDHQCFVLKMDVETCSNREASLIPWASSVKYHLEYKSWPSCNLPAKSLMWSVLQLPPWQVTGCLRYKWLQLQLNSIWHLWSLRLCRTMSAQMLFSTIEMLPLQQNSVVYSRQFADHQLLSIGVFEEFHGF